MGEGRKTARRFSAWIALALCALTGMPAFAGEVRGRVTDRADGSPLAGVNLRLMGARLGAVSDSAGTYVIPNIPAGTYRLQASMIGYRTATVEGLTLRPETVLRQDVALRGDAIPLSEVVVTPGRFSVLQSDPAAVQTLSREEVRVMPQLGEDIYRAIVRLPGVSGSDYSARFAVRGEDHGRILVTLDGLELYEPFHLKDISGGALSVVDVEVIGGIDLMAGGFPAEYGDRQSAVMEMRSRRPREGRRISAGLGLMNARVLSEGANENFGWLVSARRGYIDLVLKLIGEEENLSPDYYDLFGKLTFGKNPRSRFAVSVLGASDNLRFEDQENGDAFRSRYGNGYGWLTWEATQGAWLHGRSLLYAGRVTGRREGTTFVARTGAVNEVVDDARRTGLFGVKSDWQAEAARRHLLKVGFEARALRADYDYFSRNEVTTISGGVRRTRHDTTRAVLKPTGWKTGLYVGDKWRVVGPLTADAGLRYDRHSCTGEGLLSPRAGLALAVGSEAVVRVAWGRYAQAQGIGELDVQDGATAFRRASVSTHYVAGVERRLGPGFDLRVEGYYKRLRRIRDRFENLEGDVEFVPEIGEDRVHLFPKTGIARGIEFFLKRDTGGRLGWWVAYAYATSRETFDALQGPVEVRGRTYPRLFDQPHTFSADLAYRPSPTWSLSAAWQVRSGWPFSPLRLVQVTAPNGSRFYTTEWSPDYERYPPFHRLDVKVSRQFTFQRWRLNTALEVINLYNRRNVRHYEYDFSVSGGQIVTNRRVQSWLPILPSLTVSAEF